MRRLGIQKWLVAGIALLVAANPVVLTSPASAARTSPHGSASMIEMSHLAPSSIRDPSGNVTPVPAIANTPDCGGTSNSPINSQPCIKDALGAINHARALEGVPPMHLPSNFAFLSEAQKNFTVTNAERVDRGLQPLKALCSFCDVAASGGIADGYDPFLNWPFPAGVTSYTSNWAGGAANVLVADYYWMYDDGWGGSKANTFNFDCTSPTAQGCWGHRHDILVSCQSACDLYYGAAEGRSPINWPVAYADIVVGMLPGSRPSLDAGPPAAWPVPSCTPAQSYGYRSFSADGAVASRGLLTWCGGMDNFPHPPSPVVAGANSWDRGGYYLVSRAGRVWGFGDAHAVTTTSSIYPASNNMALLSTVTAFASDPVKNGYWELGVSWCTNVLGCGSSVDRTIASFGDAKDYGVPTNLPQGVSMVGITSSPDAKGYWILLSNGQVDSFGDAPAYAPNGTTTLIGSAVSIARDASGKGFWVLTSSGQVVGYGDAQNYGNATPAAGRTFVSISGDHSGAGYWVLTSAGHAYNFGDAKAFPDGATSAVAIAS